MIKLNLTFLLRIFSFILPALIIFIIFINSIIYNDYLKILFFLIGLCILFIINILFKLIFKEPLNNKANPLCNLSSYLIPNALSKDEDANFFIKIISIIFDNISKYSMPSLTISMISFIVSYLIYPMIQNNNYNYFILVILLISTVFICINEYYNLCSNFIGISFGLMLGIIVSIIYTTYIGSLETKKTKLLYFSYIPRNNNSCKQIGDTFVCDKHTKAKSLKYKNTETNYNLNSINNYRNNYIYKLPCTYNYSLDTTVDCSNYLLPLRKKDKCDLLSNLMGCGSCLTNEEESREDASGNLYFPDKYRNRDLNSNTNPPTYMSRITKCITEPSFNLIKLPITTGTDLNNDGYNTFLIDSNDIDVCKSVSNTLGCNNPNFSNEDLCTMSSNVFKKYNMNFSLINSKNFNNKVKGTKINIYSLDNRQPNRRGRILNIIGTEL
tara:strand:- start:8628 stop:9947 length:1320 start_codon:yes stop_codon:yes gene_type:complete